MSIRFEYKEKAMEEIHGNKFSKASKEYSKKSELKKDIKSIMKNYECPKCGGHRINGERVVVEIGKVRLFREEKKEGIFRTKYIEKHDRDIYQVYNVYLESGGFLSSAGYLRCKSCKWEQKGRKGTQVNLRIDSSFNQQEAEFDEGRSIVDETYENEKVISAHPNRDIVPPETMGTEIEGTIRSAVQTVKLETNVTGHVIEGTRRVLDFIPLFERRVTRTVQPKRVTVLNFLIEPSTTLSWLPYSVISAEMSGKQIRGTVRDGDRVVVTGKMNKSRNVFIATEIRSLRSGEKISRSWF